MTNLNQVAILASAYSSSIPSWVFPSTTSETYGSLEFARTSEISYIQYAASNDWAVGTGAFTIEWQMFMQQDDFYPRIFSIGTYNTTPSLAVSIEGGTFYFWMGDNALFGVSLDNPFNQWNHIAVVRDSESTLSLYNNGGRIAQQENVTFNITDNARDLYIGTENPADIDTQYNGYLTAFRWANGEALYTGESYSVPTGPLEATAGTKLLLNTLSDEDKLIDGSAIERVPSGGQSTDWTNYAPY